MPPPRENAYNFVVCRPKATKQKTNKLPIDAYKRWEFRKNSANEPLLRGEYVGSFDSFEGCIPTFLPR